MFEFRVAGGEWYKLVEGEGDEDAGTFSADDDTVVFMMEDRGIDYVTYDGEVPYLPGVDGKVEYKRV